LLGSVVGDYPAGRSQASSEIGTIDSAEFFPEILSMLGIGPMELMIVLLIGLLLFGSRLPSTMRSLGKSVSEFKKGMEDGENDPHQAVAASEPPLLPDGRAQAL
jgi:sec-independent protein translocase protein TatA